MCGSKITSLRIFPLCVLDIPSLKLEIPALAMEIISLFARPLFAISRICVRYRSAFISNRCAS